jgi:inorganic pyrophosphatase
LDILVAAYDPAFPGCMVRVRPIGALDMSDSSGRDRTIMAVPDDDPRFADIKNLGDLPDQNMTEVEEFFEVYKRLEGDEDVEIHGWLSLEEAHQVIRDSTRQ